MTRIGVLLIGAVAHGAALVLAISDAGDWPVAARIGLSAAYLAALALLGALWRPRVAFAVVLGESVMALALGMSLGGFDNEAWGASIVALTVIAAAVLALATALGRLRGQRGATSSDWAP